MSSTFRGYPEKTIPDIETEEWSKKQMEDKGKGKLIARCQEKSVHQDGRGDRHTNAMGKKSDYVSGANGLYHDAQSGRSCGLEKRLVIGCKAEILNIWGVRILVEI